MDEPSGADHLPTPPGTQRDTLCCAGYNFRLDVWSSRVRPEESLVVRSVEGCPPKPSSLPTAHKTTVSARQPFATTDGDIACYTGLCRVHEGWTDFLKKLGT